MLLIAPNFAFRSSSRRFEDSSSTGATSSWGSPHRISRVGGWGAEGNPTVGTAGLQPAVVLDGGSMLQFRGLGIKSTQTQNNNEEGNQQKDGLQTGQGQIKIPRFSEGFSRLQTCGKRSTSTPESSQWLIHDLMAMASAASSPPTEPPCHYGPSYEWRMLGILKA